MGRALESIEETCLESEAWAEELEAWVSGREGDPRCADAESIAALLRALVRSIRLSIVAEEDAADRDCLVEELEGTLGQARKVASTGASEDRPTPVIETRTKPPPPGLSPKDVLERQPIPDLPLPPRRRAPPR